MHPISPASIESLPNELLLPILETCVVPSLFSVCKRWHHLLASEAMPSLYKKIAQLHFPQKNTTTQRTLMLAKVYQLNPVLTSTEKAYHPHSAGCSDSRILFLLRLEIALSFFRKG
ncbi:F-box protein [Neochlamydia sp. S13]|uniref:F-box protein n=1 Tax=Neochlamydia sp. S13 TaxID=1353976 RepID=UPI000FD18834|nr:F-box protein [Neochlamydia sp. S13]BBI16395.1 hypothetical protein NCS13_1_0200 [Neochlamydia sp. S13]